MATSNHFEVIIAGGSYSGLAAGLALGRALRKVLIIDSGIPCNRQTPHSHNFLTQDGKSPKEITAFAIKQVKMYNTVTFFNGLVTNAVKTRNGFEVQTVSGETFIAKKLIFATGIKDIMPAVPGFPACWGITALHCPYCHGYEVRDQKTGIWSNGDQAFGLAMLISHWTKDLTLFTNGRSTLTVIQTAKLARHNIHIIEPEIKQLEHRNGYLENILLKNGSKAPIKVLYARLPFVQHCNVPQALGCTLTTEGYIQTDLSQKTSVPGIYACGDNTTPMRTLANAVAMGTTAGMAVNRELIEEAF